MVIKLTLTIINIQIQVEIKGGSISIRPEIVIFTSNKSVDELLYDNQGLYNEINNIAFKKRIVEIKLDGYDKNGDLVVQMFEFNANLFQRNGWLT